MPIRPLALCGLLLATVFAFLTPDASAQDDQINIRELARKGRTVQSWARAPLSGENQRVFDQFFMRYYFPEMLKRDTESLGKLAEHRKNLFDRYIWLAHPTVQRDLTAKAFTFSRSAIGGRHPAPVKYNALLILGLLDEQYASKSDFNSKPLSQANELLCRILAMSVDQRRLPNYMQVGALVGLERHAKFIGVLGDKEKRDTAAALLKAVNQQEYRPGTSRSVQYWMKLQAARALANTQAAGPNGSFASAVAKLISDDKADLATRCAAAQLLESFKLESVPENVGRELVGAMKGLACSVAEVEKEAADGFTQVQSTRSYGPTSLDVSPRYQRTETGWEYERRGLVAQLEQLKTGLSAVGAAAGQDADAVNSIRIAVASAITTATEDNIDFDVVDSIRAMHREIDRVAGCKPQPVEEEADDDAELLGG